MIAMILFIFLIVLVNALFFRSLANDFRDITATVSVAGKLRLMSKKIELDMIQFAANPAQGARAVRNSMAEFDMAIKALSEGGRVFGVTVKQTRTAHERALQNVRKRWQEYQVEIGVGLSAAAFMASSASKENMMDQRDQIAMKATQLLHASERLVDSIVKDMQRRQRVATLYMYGALTLVFTSFLLGLWFVRRRIATPLDLLYEGTQRLRQGDYQVQLHYPVADELGRLVRSFNTSAQHISKVLDDLEHSNHTLKRIETMFEGLTDNPGIAVYVLSGQQFLFVNQEMADLLGYEREAMLSNLRVDDIFIEEYSATVFADHHDSLTSEPCDSCLVQPARRQDGSMIEFEVFQSRRVPLDGKCVTICVALDITKRCKNEAFGRLARLVYEASSDAMVLTDADARVIHVNPAFTKITGYKAQDVLGQRMSVLSSGRHDREFYETMWSSIVKTGAWVGEVWNKRKDGKEFVERLSINTSYDEKGRVQYRVGLFADITKQKKQNFPLVHHRRRGVSGTPEAGNEGDMLLFRNARGSNEPT